MADTLTIDDDRLPWLEAVEDEDERTGPSAAKLIGALAIGLIALAAIIYAIFAMGSRDAGSAGASEIVAAEPGAYKVKPAEASGLKVEGEGDTAFAASEGADPNGRINLAAIPEAPVAGARGITPAEQLKTRPAEPVATPAPKAAPVEAPAAGLGSVQLGAFSSNAGAQAAWKSLSGRFASLGPLTNSVAAASVDGKTVYRLRASVASRVEATTLCGKLKVAGESCVVIE